MLCCQDIKNTSSLAGRKTGVAEQSFEKAFDGRVDHASVLDAACMLVKLADLTPVTGQPSEETCKINYPMTPQNNDFESNQIMHDASLVLQGEKIVALRQAKTLTKRKSCTIKRKFPQQLMDLLSRENICIGSISWTSDGEMFSIIDSVKFSSNILPFFFSKETQFSSFTRKLRRWGFERIDEGEASTPYHTYFHKYFRRNNKRMTHRISCKDITKSLSKHLRGARHNKYIGGKPISHVQNKSALHSMAPYNNDSENFSKSDTEKGTAYNAKLEGICNDNTVEMNLRRVRHLLKLKKNEQSTLFEEFLSLGLSPHSVYSKTSRQRDTAIIPFQSIRPTNMKPFLYSRPAMYPHTFLFA